MWLKYEIPQSDSFCTTETCCHRSFQALRLQTLYELFRGTEGYSHASCWMSVGLNQQRPPELRCLRLRVADCDENKQHVDILAQCSVTSTFPFTEVLMEVEIKYRVYSNRRVRLANHVVPKQILRRKISSLPRVGMQFQLDRAFYRTRYFGRGPGEVSSLLCAVAVPSSLGSTIYLLISRARCCRTIRIGKLVRGWAYTTLHLKKCTRSTLFQAKTARAPTASGLLSAGKRITQVCALSQRGELLLASVPCCTALLNWRRRSIPVTSKGEKTARVISTVQSTML